MQDYSFNMEQIEAVSTALYEGTIQVQKEASSYLYAWQQSNDCFDLAINIVQNTKNMYAMYSSLIVISNHLKINYSKMSEELKNQLKNIAVDQLKKTTELVPIKKVINDIIVTIALHEWPQNWNEFPFGIYPQSNDTELLDLFHVFLTDVLYSPFIITSRRQELLSHINDSTSRIFSFVIPLLSNSSKIKSSINLVLVLARISPIEHFYNEDIFHTIFCGFQVFDSVHIECVQLASLIFIKRVDSTELFAITAPLILTNAANITNQSKFLSRFMIKFLLKYGELLEKVIFDDPTVSSLKVKIQEKMTIEDLKQSVLCQYVYTFTSPVTQSSRVHLVWKLWFSVFERAFTQITESGESTTLFLFSDIYTVLSKPFLNILTYTINEGVIKDKIVFKCFSYFYKCNSQSASALIFQEQITIQTNYAFGILIASISDEIESSFYVQAFSNVFHEISTLELSVQTAPMVASGLFALSRCSKCINSENSLIERFIYFLIRCLECQCEGIQDSSSHALNYLSKKNQNIYYVNNNFLFFHLLQNLENFLGLSCGSRIFKIICRQISFMENQNSFYQLVSYPIQQRFYNFLSMFPNSDWKQIQIAFECLMFKSSETKCSGEIFKYLWQQILDISLIVFDPLFHNEEFVNYLFLILSIGFCESQYEMIQIIIKRILEMIKECPHLFTKSFFLIAALRNAHQKFEEFLPNIVSDIILPYISNNNDLETDYFEMISKFNVGIICIQQICKSILGGIESLKSDNNEAAISCIMCMIRKFDKQQIDEFNCSYRRSFVLAVLNSLFDMLHSSSFNSLVKLLNVLMLNSVSDLRIDLEIFESLCSILNEQNSLVYLDFIKQLKVHKEDEKMFACMVREFLIQTCRITPIGLIQLENPKQK